MLRILTETVFSSLLDKRFLINIYLHKPKKSLIFALINIFDNLEKFIFVEFFNNVV